MKRIISGSWSLFRRCPGFNLAQYLAGKDDMRRELWYVDNLKNYIFLLIVLASSAGLCQPLERAPVQGSASSPRYRIGVIDTGYYPAEARSDVKLCKEGHFDYLTGTPNLNYTHPHGTQVMNLIAQRLGPSDVDYCFVVYQVTSIVAEVPRAEHIAEALVKATAAGLTAVNMSIDSTKGPGSYSKEEDAAVKAATSNGVAVFMAAGNAGAKLDKGSCDYYPACYGPYKNFVIVGGQSHEDPKKPDLDYNNGSRVDVYAPDFYAGDDDVVSYGTSYAAPRALAEYILYLEQRRLGQHK